MIRAGDISIPSYRDARDQAERDAVDAYYRERLAVREEQRQEYAQSEDMTWPVGVSVERVRPAVRDDREGSGAARGIAAGLLFGVVFWLPAVILGVPIVKDAVA
jgi:hypothetical protein